MSRCRATASTGTRRGQDERHALGQDVWNAERLPDAYVNILADMSGALHDTISAPEIAANFESTPEQLLARVRAL